MSDICKIICTLRGDSLTVDRCVQVAVRSLVSKQNKLPKCQENDFFASAFRT